MDIVKLQEQIDEISVILYQNREQEAMEQIGGLLGQLKLLTDCLLQVKDRDEQQIISCVSLMYQIFYAAYAHKDMLGMADCLQKYALLATELYKIKC